jgi:MFS family permease
VNLAAPFYPVFFMQKLGLPLWSVIALGTFSSMMGLAANSFWTRAAHRFGMKPVVLIATAGEALFPLCLIFIDSSWMWLLLLVHLTGIFNTPIAIGPDNFILKLSPQQSASSYMAVFRAFVGPATALAAILGGWLAGSLSVEDGAAAGMALGGLKIVFLLSFAGRIGSLFILARVIEPTAYPVARMLLLWNRTRRRLAWRRSVALSRWAGRFWMPQLPGEMVPANETN